MPDSLLDLETKVLRKLVPGPMNWIVKDDLFRLHSFLGMPEGFKSIRCSAIAAKVRVYFNEKIDWDGKARELQDLVQVVNDELPITWLGWFHRSTVLTVVRGVQEFETWALPRHFFFARVCEANSLDPSHLPEVPGNLYVSELDDEQQRCVKVRKEMQKSAYREPLSSKMLQPTEWRMRKKMERWCIDAIYPGKLARLLTHRMGHLHSLVSPRVIAAMIRTWFNGWCTTRRFQGTGRCMLCQAGPGSDCIEHYATCRVTNSLRAQLKLPETFNSLQSFMLGLPDITDAECTVSLLVVYAVYNAVNTLRHTGIMPPDQIMHMLIEFCKIAAASHGYSLKVFEHVFNGYSEPGRAKPARRRKRRDPDNEFQHPSRNSRQRR